MEKTLSNYFPTEILDDVKCNIITEKRSIEDLYDLSTLKYPPNFNRKNLGKIKPSLYCISNKGQRRITMLSTKEPLYTPDRFLSLTNVNYAVVANTKTEESNVVAFGDTSACHNDHFKYNIQTEKTGITVLKAKAQASETKLRFLEKFFGFPSVYNKKMRDVLFQYFRLVGSLRLHNMEWTTVWNGKEKRFDLLKSDQGKTLMYFPAFGSAFIDKDQNVTIQSPEILLGSRKRFLSMYFSVQGLSTMDFVRTQFASKFGTIADMLDKLGISDYLKLYTVSIFS